ncbi:hypothetical protein [Streptomyces flavofungini]|uniref:hypothetical protein n=1 Tax=Streptomyces flavofungini TaxID=68200 RepID=UPI0034DFE312
MSVRTEASWPEGVIARYLTVGSATVDVRHKLNAFTPPEPLATRVACAGCLDSEEFNHYRVVRGMHSSWDVRDTDAADQDARRWAQAHAEKCRALPKPSA